MHQRLTDLGIAAIKPPATGQAIYKDSGSPLRLRVSYAGAKTFFVIVGQGARHTIGRFGEVSLAEAREVARRIRAEKALGKYHRHSITWDSATAAFLKEKEHRRPATFNEYRRILARYFPFGTGKLTDITKRSVLDKLDRIEAKSQREHALVCARVFFRWAVAHDYIEIDPTAGLKKAPQTSRSRVLTDDEIRRIWRATDEPTPHNQIVRLLLLTGQRRNEIASLKADYIKDDLCTLPGYITKNKTDHQFPIGPCSAAILSRAITTSRCFSLYIFSSRSNTNGRFNGWSKSKAALDHRSRVPDWTLHDLRRTFRTIHAKIGTPPHIAERLINHVAGVASD